MSNINQNIIKLIAIIIVAACLIFSLISKLKKREQLYRNYPALNITDELNSTVQQKLEPRGLKKSSTISFIEIEGEKIRIYARLNSQYPNKGINDIIQPQDSIYKDSGSDTIFIYKHNPVEYKTYYFILNTN